MKTALTSLLPLLGLLACNDASTEPAPDAEPSTFEVTLTNTTPTPGFHASGVFDTPVGAAEAGPLTPGSAYAIRFPAAPGYPGVAGATRMTFASMFVPSNDLFFSPGPEGLRLFMDDGTPITGDVTDQIFVWDAGTEDDQTLNGDMTVSPNQKPWQDASAMDVGPADPDNTVRLAESTYPGEIPAIGDLITAGLSYDDSTGSGYFTLTLTNASGPGTLPGTGAFDGAVPLSPGVWTVWSAEDGAPGALFDTGMADAGAGLGDIAEDGVPASLAASVGSDTGTTFVSSPGVWVVQSSDGTLFDADDEASENGLEAIAEDGDNTVALTNLPDDNGVDALGAIGEMPLGPGASTTFTVTARPGNRLAFATMLVPSNDLLFATDPEGIALFDESGNPRGGDVSSSVHVWDAGTEQDQPEGIGLDQVHLQATPNTGADDSDPNVRRVSAARGLPSADELLSVDITVVE